MKNEQLAAQLRLAASILETGHPFEYQNGGYWFRPSTCENMQKPLDYILDKHEIRLALATPGDSRPLHNPDNLTAEKVGAGWRLFIDGDLFSEESEIWSSVSSAWCPTIFSSIGHKPLQSDTCRLPLSTPWPEAKVDEYAELKAAHKAGKVIQHNHLSISSDPCWKDIPSPTWDSPLWRYRIKPEPVMVPLEAKDVPPCSILAVYPKEAWHSIIWVGLSTLQISKTFSKVEEVSFDELQKDKWQINKSIPITGKWDANAWEKCEKEAV